MTERSLHWDGASVGDAQALTVNAADGIGWRLANTDYESPFVDRALRMILNGTGNRGVLKGWANELAVAGVATPVTVDTGGAVVYGMPYENTVSVNVAVTTPTTDVRQDYVVLRRDWDAQTIRITLIQGVEGGDVPALTQSPAPDGSGIYDIPLATLSTTTGGVITVTDAREWCTFGTVPQDDSLATAHFTNESADLTSRATRAKRIFLGGGDMEPNSNSGRFSYSDAAQTTYGVTGPSWGSAVVSEEGWQIVNVKGLLANFIVPVDYATGGLTIYGWLESDSAGTGGASIYAMAQYYSAGGTVNYQGRSSTSIIASAQGEIARESILTFPAVTAGDIVLLAIYEYAASGTGRLWLGLEAEYTGYL